MMVCMTMTREAFNMPDLPDDPTGMEKVMAQLVALGMHKPYEFDCDVCGQHVSGTIRTDQTLVTLCSAHRWPEPHECSTCEGSHRVPWEPGAVHDADEFDQPCPDCGMMVRMNIKTLRYLRMSAQAADLKLVPTQLPIVERQIIAYNHAATHWGNTDPRFGWGLPKWIRITADFEAEMYGLASHLKAVHDADEFDQ
jgi:hypothetical protein